MHAIYAGLNEPLLDDFGVRARENVDCYGECESALSIMYLITGGF